VKQRIRGDATFKRTCVIIVGINCTAHMER